MTRSHRITAAIGAVALVLAGALGALVLTDRDGGSGSQTALAQERFAEQGINVEAEGQVNVTPDVARILLGIEVEGTDLEQLREDADGRMNDVVDALLEMGFKEADLQTVTYDIYVVDEPEEPIREVDEPAIQEDPDDAVTDDDEADDAVMNDEEDEDVAVQTFRIVQLLQVKVTDIDAAGDVIDTALDSGANRVAGISFEVEDREAAVREARELAVEQAREKAEHLAELTGVTLGAPLWIEEWSPSGPAVRMEEPAMEMDVADDAAAPRIEPGEQTISVSVDIIYAIE